MNETKTWTFHLTSRTALTVTFDSIVERAGEIDLHRDGELIATVFLSQVAAIVKRPSPANEPAERL